MRLLFVVCLAAVALRSEIVDRLALTVGGEVITELQIDEEIRVTAFLNHQPVNRDINARRKAANRLIDQLLVKREMQLSRYPLPDADDINKYFAQVRSGFPQDLDFDRELAAYALTEEVLRDHLTLQLDMLRFIEYRFRPDAGVSEAHTDQALDSWLKESRKQSSIVYLDRSLQ